MSVPVGGGYYARTPMVDFSWLSSGWDLFKQRSGSWVGATFLYGLIAFALTVLAMIPTGIVQWEMAMIQSITQGATQKITPMPTMNLPLLYGAQFAVNIFNTVLVGGLFRMAYRQVEGEQVGVLDLFSAGRFIVPFAALGAIYAAVALLNSYTCGIPSLIFCGCALFAPIIIVTKGVGAPTAIAESFQMLKSQWLMSSLFVLVGMLMIGFSGLLCGLGSLITVPMFVLAVAVGYKSFTGSQFGQFPGYGPAQPGVWPPPPGSAPPYGQQPPYGQAPGPYGQPSPYGNPPGTPPPYGQPVQPPIPPQPPQSPWQPPEQGPGQPPQGGGQWLGGEPQNDDPNNRA